MDRRTVVRVACAVSLALALAVCAAPIHATSAPWPMFGHDAQHTGRSPFNGPGAAGYRWRYLIGDFVYSSPAIAADGTIYVGSSDDHLYALNPNGTLRWRYPTGGEIWSSPAIGPDGTIYVGSTTIMSMPSRPRARCAGATRRAPTSTPPR